MVTVVGAGARKISEPWIWPLTQTDSIRTGGGLVLGRSCRGSTETRPLMVGNQRRPLAAQAAGCAPCAQTRVGRPSPCPKHRTGTELVLPLVNASRSERRARIRPTREPIQ